jgi:hypothetical protein
VASRKKGQATIAKRLDTCPDEVLPDLVEKLYEADPDGMLVPMLDFFERRLQKFRRDGETSEQAFSRTYFGIDARDPLGRVLMGMAEQAGYTAMQKRSAPKVKADAGDGTKPKSEADHGDGTKPRTSADHGTKDLDAIANGYIAKDKTLTRAKARDMATKSDAWKELRARDSLA